MSWLAPFVNGIIDKQYTSNNIKQSPIQSNNHYTIHNKYKGINQQIHKNNHSNFKNYKKPTQDTLKDYSLKKNYSKINDQNINIQKKYNFSKKKLPVSTSQTQNNFLSNKKNINMINNISSSLNMKSQRIPLQAHSLNMLNIIPNKNQLYKINSVNSYKQEQDNNITISKIKQQKYHNNNINHDSIDKFNIHNNSSLNESVGKIIRNKSFQQSQTNEKNKENYNQYFYDKIIINNKYSNFMLTNPNKQFEKTSIKYFDKNQNLTNNQSFSNYQTKKSYCSVSKKEMDDQDKKLQDMQERLNNVIRRSAGKIKSSKQTRIGKTQFNYLQSNKNKEKQLCLNFTKNTHYKNKQETSKFHSIKSFENVLDELDKQQNKQKQCNRKNYFTQNRDSPLKQFKLIMQNFETNAQHKRHASDNKQSFSNTINYQMKNSSMSKQKIIKLLPKVQDIIPQESSDQIVLSSTRYFPHFKKIFKILDIKESGLLSKSNCGAQKLHEQLKYMLGSVLTKIKYQSQTYQCQKFILQCQKITNSLDSDEIKQILQKISINFLDLQTKRSFYENQQNNQTKRSFDNYNSNKSPKDSIIVKKYEFQKRQAQNFIQDDTKPMKKLERQPYLDQPSIMLSATSNIISPLKFKEYNQKQQNQISTIEIKCSQKESESSLTKNPYVMEQNDSSQFEEMRNLRFSKIAPGKDLFQNNQHKDKKQPFVKSQNINKQYKNEIKSQMSNIKQRNQKIINLNKRLNDYIKNIPLDSGLIDDKYQLKLQFKQLTKNLKA